MCLIHVLGQGKIKDIETYNIELYGVNNLSLDYFIDV